MEAKQSNHLFANGFNCSQAILAAQCESLGVDVETASRMAVAFGGGVGRQGRICGCVSGALMVIGLKHGHDSTTDAKKRIHTYELAKAFCSRFVEVNGALDCRDIIRYNLDHPEERQKAQDSNVFQTRCARVVANTEMLLKEFL